MFTIKRRALFLLLVGILCSASLITGQEEPKPETAEPTPAVSTQQSYSSFDKHALFQEVLDWATQEAQVITAEQRRAIWKHYSERVKALEQQNGTNGFFQTVATATSQITLLHVLYVGGTVIILFGMMLLMFFGSESFGGGGVCLISILYIGIFLLGGQLFWDETSLWRIVGGVLNTFAVCTAPLAVYGYLLYTDQWQTPNGPMTQPLELATILFGLIVLYFRRFPFTLVPITFASWLYVLDAPRGYLDEHQMDVEPETISAIFGAFLFLIGYLLDRFAILDYALWIYIFACVSFCYGVFRQREKQSLSRETFYLCAHVLLLYFGDSFNRYTLTIFGTFGVLAYFEFNLFRYSQCITSHTALYIRAFMSMVLLALSLHAQSLTGGGSIEYLLGVLGFVVYNVTWLKTAASAHEIISLLHLLTNIGIISCAGLFETRPISFYFFSFDGTYPLIAMGVLGIIANSTSAFYFEIELKYRNSYCWYRIAVGVFLSGLTLAMPRNPFGLVWAGVVSIVEFTWMALAWKLPNLKNNASMLTGHFIATIIAITLSSLFQIDFLIFLSVGMMVFVQSQAWKFLRHAFLLHAFVLALVAIFLDNRTILSLATLMVLGWCVKTAHSVFRRSLLFPITLVTIGGCVIVLGFQYQNYSDEIRSTLLNVTQIGPMFDISVQFFTWLGTASEKTWVKPVAWLGWPALGVKALSENIQLLPYCLILFLVISFGSELSSLFFQEDPIDETAPDRITITDFQICFPKDTDGNGLVFAFKGTKDPSFKIDTATLFIEGEQLWAAVEDLAGAALINSIKVSFHPLKLIPNKMSKSFIRVGSDSVEGYIQLCTGEQGEPRVSQSTIRSTLRKLLNYGDPLIQLKVVYTNRKAYPRRGILFKRTIAPSKALNSIRENINIKDILVKRWNL